MQEATTISSDDPATATASAAGGVDRRLLIDGKLLDTSRTYPSLNPATGRGARPRAGCHGRPRRSGRRRGAARLRRDRLVDQHRVADPLPRAVPSGADRPPRRTRRADHRRGRRDGGAVPGRSAGPADRDRPLLRRPAEDVSDDRRPRQYREPRYAAPPLGGEGGGRSRRRDHRLQLSQPAGAGQARTRAGGRLHGDSEVRARHPADHAGAGRVDREPHRHPRRRRERAQLVPTPRSVPH